MLFQQVVEHGMGMLTWGPPGKRNIPKETPRSCFASHVSAWDGGLKKKMCPNKLWCQHICQNMSTANGWRLSPSGFGSASICAWPFRSHQHQPEHREDEPDLWYAGALLFDVRAPKIMILFTPNICIPKWSQQKLQTILEIDILDLPRPAGKYLLYGPQRYLTGGLAWLAKQLGLCALTVSLCMHASLLTYKLRHWSLHHDGSSGAPDVRRVLLRKGSPAAMSRAHWKFIGYPNKFEHEPVKTCQNIIVMSISFCFFFPKELMRMAGNCIHVRAASIAIIILMKAVDPALLQRYLDPV